MSPMQRSAIKAAPDLAARGVSSCGSARHLVRNSYPGSRAIARVRRGTARVDVRASVFCSVREPVAHPLCRFYAAAFTRLLALFDLRSRAEVVSCRGTGESSCVLTIAHMAGAPQEAKG